MDRIKTSEDIDHYRRRFFGAAAMTFAAAQSGADPSGIADDLACQASMDETAIFLIFKYR
jgi:hypothetical protein